MSAGDLVFDIETGPLLWEQLKAVYQPPEALPPWDDSMPKYGRTKDPAKRQAIYDNAKAAYAARLADQDAAAEEHRQAFCGRAALSPLTGRVLAIGIGNGKQSALIGADGETETEILESWWSVYRKKASDRARLIGFNSNGFDVPFLVRRSWACGVAVPGSLFERGKWLASMFVDLMLLWSAGSRDSFCKLDTLARFFGVGGKPEGVDGGHFASLWLSGDADSRQAAVDYALNDIAMTWKLAERMQVV